MNKNAVPSPETIGAVARMQHYIGEHIKEQITQRQLAGVARYSQYHSARIFKELTGKTPFEYIRRLRLSQSAMVLRDEKARVLDVALEYVFDSHEGFTRAFSKEFGVTPKAYSQKSKPIKLFMPSNIKDFYLLNKESEGKTMKEQSVTQKEPAKVIFTQVVDRPARKLIVKRGRRAEHYFEYCEEVGCEVWGILSSVKEALYEPIGMWMPENLRPAGTSVYTQGVEVPLDYRGEIPEGFELMELPACKIMVFQGQPYEDETFMDAIGEFWEQTKNFSPEIYGYEWADEAAPKFQLMPMGYRGYIEGRPVREVNQK